MGQLSYCSTSRVISRTTTHEIVMGILDDELQYVISRFPERTRRINKLYISNEDFRQICIDYHACFNMLRQLLSKQENLSQMEEYKALKVSLELELLTYLDDLNELTR